MVITLIMRVTTSPLSGDCLIIVDFDDGDNRIMIMMVRIIKLIMKSTLLITTGLQNLLLESTSLSIQHQIDSKFRETFTENTPNLSQFKLYIGKQCPCPRVYKFQA